jgi:hypothetical protein
VFNGSLHKTNLDSGVSGQKLAGGDEAFFRPRMSAFFHVHQLSQGKGFMTTRMQSLTGKAKYFIPRSTYTNKDTKHERSCLVCIIQRMQNSF